jgi:WD40 repeat protein
VLLPPWADTAETFVRLNREALESEHVSANIHLWIDLIFGYKQQGREAEQAFNVFYYMTYEGSVDPDAAADPVLRDSMISQIYNFGQTPSQLLKVPHPRRAAAQEGKKSKSKSFLSSVSPPAPPPSTVSSVGSVVGSTSALSIGSISAGSTPIIAAPISSSSSSSSTYSGGSSSAPSSAPSTPQISTAAAAPDLTSDPGSPTLTSTSPSKAVPSALPYSYIINTPATIPFVVMLPTLNLSTSILMIGCDGLVANATVSTTPDGHGLPFTLDLDKTIATTKARKVQQQVGEWVSAVSNIYALSMDGKVLISCADADQAILYSAVATCRPIRRVVGHLGPITCLALAEDGILVTGSMDHTVLVWDTAAIFKSAGSSWGGRGGRDDEVSPDFPIHTLTGHDDAIQCVVVSSDLDIVVSGSRDGTCIIHTLRRPKYVRSLYIGTPVDLLRLSKEGDVISFCTMTHTLWAHTINGTLLGMVEVGPIDAIAIDTQGRYLVTGSHNGGDAAVLIRALRTGLPILHQFDSDVGIRALTFTCDDKYLMAGLEDGRLSIFDFNPALWV